jgi:CubicO group peptidase (beta-lactamase class C family)
MNMDFLNDLDGYLKMKRYRLVNAVLVYENSALVFEGYYNNFDENKTNPLMSVWKSILSLTLGICLDKGLIKSVDDPISRYLPQFAQNIHPYHGSITIRHLLTMSSGIYFNGGIHYHCPMMEQMRRSRDWVAHIADVEITDFPGTKFVYKEWDVILLSAVISNACGGMAWDIAERYLYTPLEIRSEKWLNPHGSINYNVGDVKYDEMTARDLLKIGLLVHSNGVWKGKRIISEEYIKAAVSPSESNEGYGYLWWLSNKGYHGRGFGGQELNVYPDKNIIAVIQAKVTPSDKSYGDICENIVK